MMKIEKVHIVGFGKWSDVTFQFTDDFQVIIGPNESGKTTLKDFILGVFFGFPRGRRTDQQLYQPRSGAQYGGQVTIRTKKGRFVVERLGRTQSTLTVSSVESGLTLPNPEGFLKKMFDPLDEQDFRRVFSFDEQELETVSQLTDTDFEQALLTYTKPETQSLISWANERQKEGLKLFAKGKNGKRPLNLANQRFRDLKKKQREAGQREDQYQKLIGQQLEEKKRLDDVLSKEQELEHALHEKNKQVSDWPLYRELLASKGSINQSNSFPDEQLVKDVQQLEQEQLWLTNQEEKQQKELETIQQSLSSIIDVDSNVEQMKSVLASIREKQRKARAIVSDVAQVGSSFHNGLPMPLTRKEEAVLLNHNQRALITAVSFSGLGLLLIILHSIFWLPSLLLIVVGALTYWNDWRKKASVLQRFSPLNKSEIQAKQTILQETWHQQKQLPELEEEISKETSQLRSNLQEMGLVNQDNLFEWSDSQVQDWTNQYLTSIGGRKQSTLQTQLATALQRQQDLHQQARNLQERIQASFSPYGVTNFNEFYKLADSGKQLEKSAERNTLIKTQLGQEQTTFFSKLSQEAAGADSFDLLSEQQSRLRQQLAEIQEKKTARQQRIANLSSEANQLVEKGDLIKINQDLSNLEEDLKQQYAHYLAQVMAPEVVKMAFLGKEEALSIQILDQAAAYLAQLTEGRYQRIVLDDSTLLVINASDQSFRAVELSAGTRDLLFLAVRLALATMIHSKQPLPLLVDDAFVHLDAKRRQAALVLLQEIATEQQVIFLTFDQGLTDDTSISLT